MKILQIANGFPPRDQGGVEIYTQNLCRHLRARGHDTGVFCREDRAGQPNYTVRDEVIEDVPVRFVNNRFDPAIAWELQYRDPTVETLFARWIEEQRPDVLHFQHTLGLSASLIACAQERGIPFVVTLHDYWYMCPQVHLLRPDRSICAGSQGAVNCYECLYSSPFPPRTRALRATRGAQSAPAAAEWHPLGMPDGLYQRLQRLLPWPVRRRLLDLYDLMRLRVAPWLVALARGGQQPDLRRLRERAGYMQQLLSSCPYIVVPSTKVEQFYQGFGVPAQAIHVIPHGMELGIWAGFQPAARPRGGNLRFGYIGSLLPHKGIDLMIRAFRQIESPDAELRIHGFEIAHSSFTDQIHRLAAADPRICFRGPYQQSDLPGILNELDVLLLPALWHETFSLVSREAVLAGLPILASHMGGIPDIIEDQANGILLPPGDLDAWTAAMRRLIDDPALVTSLHRNQMARKVKSMPEHAEELLHIYAQLRASEFPLVLP